MIILVFLLGMAVAPLAAFFECLPIGFEETGELKCFTSLFPQKIFPFPWGLLLYIFLGIAAIEEIFKYLVVKLKVLRSSEFDEPLDAMLYMIIAALGFAALENILILFFPEEPLLIGEASIITSFRFIGATFLHALCSGTIGYFLARSFFEPKKRKKLLFTGFALAIGLHGLFNLSIIMVDKKIITAELGFSLVAVILVFLAVFVTLGFRKLKKLSSICKINPPTNY